MSIIIFSKPIHSGKTTELQHWCSQQQNIAGILMPDINGKRKMLDIKTKKVFEAECKDSFNKEEELASIGRYHFYTAAFQKANAIIIHALNENPSFLIIDEVGKLELNKKGFYPALQKTIAAIQDKKFTANLLLVVRDSLVKEATAFFKIQEYNLIEEISMLPSNHPDK